MSERVLTVEHLRVELPVPAGTLHAVQGVSFHVDLGETVCIVGESGCGKTLTALAVMDLLPQRAQRTATRLELTGRNLAGLSERAMSDVRGADMAIIFQIGHGQTLGVVGESGCGKSITSLSVMRLIDRPGKIVAGEILLNGDNLLAMKENAMRDVRGDR